MSDENNLLHHDHQQQGPLCPTRSVAKDDRAMFWRRVRSFATTLYVLTGAGVIYLFSSYATQLRDRLGYSQLQVAQLASTGNLGLYLGGPPVGFLIDRFGPRPVAVTGTVLMFFAFAAIAQGYASGTAPIGAMVLAYGILGLGSASGTLSSIALNVKSFPANVRGFAVGVPVSFYGLSAFLFVQVKQHLFAATPEGITGFLRFITAFLGLGIVVAVFGMFEVPMMASSEIGGSARRLEESLVADDENDDASSSSSSSSSSGIEDVDDSGTVTDASIVMYLKRSRSWALIAIFFLGAGTGLMYVDTFYSLNETF
ncbi:major facilitator superfamily domain-containing protein [Blastocladiella britannica]|nr:major facilitator superfamily domain-containing protein [Blastocladiella britannica]